MSVTSLMVREAVESILHQTYGDFEFIIIDDGSTNNSVDYLNSLKDKRIRLIRNPENVGITKSLNIGLRAAQGRYIARMDGDDVALPNRFQKQVAFMDRHPDVIVCGSACKNIGADSRLIRVNKTNIDMETYRISALFRNPGPMHPTAFLNHALGREVAAIAFHTLRSVGRGRKDGTRLHAQRYAPASPGA